MVRVNVISQCREAVFSIEYRTGNFGFDCLCRFDQESDLSQIDGQLLQYRIALQPFCQRDCRYERLMSAKNLNDRRYKVRRWFRFGERRIANRRLHRFWHRRSFVEGITSNKKIEQFS